MTRVPTVLDAVVERVVRFLPPVDPLLLPGTPWQLQRRATTSASWGEEQKERDRGLG